MSYNKRSFELGSKRSVIREIFEYSKARKAEIGNDKVFDFSLGNPSVKPPEEVKEAIISILNESDPTVVHGYTSAQGDARVRKAVSDNIAARFGVKMSPDLIYMTCGAAASLSICLKALLDKDDEVIVFAPFFTEYSVFITNADGKVVVSTPEPKTFQVDVADFESRISPRTKAVIINSPNNPSGVVYTKDTVEKVCEALRRKSCEYKKDIYLIADEPYRELVYGDVEVPYIMNYYKNSLVCYSYSKSLSLPGERIGYIAVNPEADCAQEIYLAVCGAGRSLGYVCAPSLFQRVAARCVNTKVNIAPYKENRDILYDNLTDFGFECVKPDGAFYLFVKSPDVSATAFYEKAKKYELLVVPCDDFGIEGYVRIAYCVDKSAIVGSLPYFKALAQDYDL